MSLQLLISEKGHFRKKLISKKVEKVNFQKFGHKKSKKLISEKGDKKTISEKVNFRKSWKVNFQKFVHKKLKKLISEKGVKSQFPKKVTDENMGLCL